MASSVAPASSTNLLESLPARPPTPPREALHEVDSKLKSVVHRTLAFDPRLSLQTPPNPNSPTSPQATGSNLSSNRIRKKVEWSTRTDYRDAPHFNDSLKPHKSSPLSAPSLASSRPVKSILKQTVPNPLASTLGHEPNGSSTPNIFEMLDSSIKQLAGPDRDLKLDAYMMLSRALKASNNLPDRVALQDKMSLFMQFIQRDVTARTTSSSLDSSLINHSLTLLATFLHFPAIASTLTTDFGIFIMDHSIRSFEDETIPKDVVRHLMQVVAFQGFSPKVMTSDRVSRLLTALHSIENHIQGKSIVMSRLHIYKRLVKQSRIHMATHCDWLKDLFTDMLSTVKDIRSQAISLGMEAGFALRSEKHLLRKVTGIFQTLVGSETYIEQYIKRLQKMIKEKGTCSAVPQIWSVVILFLRCPLDRWQYYGPWLTLAQSAFNMTDSFTKQEANFAWNRYVYLSVSDSKAGPKSIGTLCQPLLSQLRRKTNSKQHDEATKLRRVVIGGICNLYYYTFIPGSDKYSPDVLWDVAVQPVISQLISLDGKPEVLGDGVMQAARLLVGLLDASTPRIWRQDRIMDSPPVTTDELPAIDAKWTRKNCDKVLQCVGPITERRFCDLAHKDSLVYRLWQALVSSMTAASAKDIKVSDDTAKFVGCALGLLSKVTKAMTNEPPASSLDVRFLNSVSNYAQLLVDGLGILPFTEKRLSMTVPNTFEPVSTPTHRQDRIDNPHGVVRMPLHHLFIMVSAISTDCMDGDTMLSFFKSMFGPFLRNKSARGRLDLTKELLYLIPSDALFLGPWLLTADSAKAVLETHSSKPTTGLSDRMLGPDYREVVSLLERCLTSDLLLATTHWLSLLTAVATRIVSDFGDAGCFLLVVEPLAKILDDAITSSAEWPSKLALEAIIALFDLAKMPRDKQALEAARSKLWGAPTPLPKVGPSESPEALFKLGNSLLSVLYQHHAKRNESAAIRPFMEAIDGFLDRQCIPCCLTAVAKLQTGLSVWVQDEEAVLTPSDRLQSLNAVANTWDHICSRFYTHLNGGCANTGQIEALLIAGFKSNHPVIVNRTALAWNSVVKDDADLGYSDSLKSIVSSIGSKVGISLHGGGKATEGFGAEETSVVSTGNVFSLQELSLMASKRSPSPSVNSPVPASSRRRMSRKRRPELTPDFARNKPKKRTSTPKLRHDNSQIQFEPIAPSSPLPEESQHLTERQKEVRERQRQTTALFSDLQPASPSTNSHNLHSPAVKAQYEDGHKQGLETTPKQNKSFSDHTRSTPTPRRGEFLQLDDLNDPPSSPPLPRPCPLLSVIQSRSRTGNSMDDWEFSSPPGSPTEPEPVDDTELPPAAPQEEASPNKALQSTRKQRKAAAKAQKYMTNAAISEKALKQNTSISEAEIVQTKQFEGVVTRARKAHETPRSGDSTPSKNEPTPRRRSSRHVKIERNGDDVISGMSLAPDAQATSDSRPPDFENADTASDLQGPPRTAIDGINKSVQSHECIMVHTDSGCLSLERLEMATNNLVLVVPSTPAEVEEPTPITSGACRKRKRGSKASDSASKKRRSTTHELVESPTPRVMTSKSPRSVQKDANNHLKSIETRSGLRKRQQQERQNEEEESQININDPPATKHPSSQGDDTDEEVFSQLVTESRAASQQSQSQQDHNMEGTDENISVEPDGNAPIGETQLKTDESANEHVEVEPHAKPAVSGDGKTLSIIESLKHGLAQLRSVSLTREKVYEVEDILMDMKRELFEAERRGRAQGRPSKSRKRKSRGH